jgi:hypothetical protein
MIKAFTDLTIKQYLQCKIISESESDPIIRKCKFLAEATNRTLDEVESLPLNELYSQLGEITNLESIPKDGKIKLKFKVGGRKFMVKWREQDISAEQYIDVSYFTKDPNKVEQNIHNILASLCVEKKWFKYLPYDGANHKQRADLFFNELKIKDAYPIMVFFCKYYNQLTKNIQSFLVEQAEELVDKLHMGSGKNGDG